MTLQSPFPVQSGMLMLFSLSMFPVIPSWSATKENLPKHLLKTLALIVILHHFQPVKKVKQSMKWSRTNGLILGH